jgi:3-phenylpropionate/trans-cinnamate dioxygenase ferredoxin reductase subunit
MRRLGSLIVADVMVVGAGLAGARTCAQLRAEGFSGRIVLVGAEPDPPYDRPPLTKHPDAEVDLRATMGIDVAAHADTVLLGVRAMALEPSPGPADRPRWAVSLSDGSTRAADAVVLAVGADPVLPAAWSGPGVHVVHTRRQAQALWAAVGSGTSLVVVGGGWIGCEVAATAAERGARVVVLEAAGSVLAGQVPDAVADRVAAWLAQVGARVRTDVRVDHVQPGPRGTVVAGEPADQVVLALGVRPATGWLAGSGIDVAADGAVLTDQVGRTNLPGVFAVGDCAARWSPRSRTHQPGGHWTQALNVPAQVAPAVVGWLAGSAAPGDWSTASGTVAEDPIPYVFSEIAGRTLALLGEPVAGTRLVWREVAEAWTCFSLDQHDGLVGLCMVGRPRDLVASRRAMLAHPRGTPRTDPVALADPDAGPQMMFPRQD